MDTTEIIIGLTIILVAVITGILLTKQAIKG